MDFLVTLLSPAKIYLLPEIGERVKIGEQVAVYETPTWSTFPDLLIDPNAELLVGLSFPVLASDWPEVSEALRNLDSRVVKYGTALSGDWRRNYPFLNSELPRTCVFEILWSDTPRAECLVAMESSAEYWYVTPSPFNGCRHPIALGIRNVDGILREYRLDLPLEFSVPVLRTQSPL